MNQHVSQWIEAYADGELRGSRLQQVEAHLQACASCQGEFEQLRKLSTLLQADPRPAPRNSPERFAAQVGLRLSRKPTPPVWQRTLRLGWQATPLGIIAVWTFLQVALFLTGVLQNLGLEQFLAPSQPVFSPSPAGFTLLNLFGTSLWDVAQQALPWLDLAEPSFATLGLELSITVITALLLWSWLVSWWAVRQRQLRPQPAIGGQSE